MSIRSIPIGDLVEPVATWNPAIAPDETFTYVDLSAVDQIEKRIKTAAPIRGSEAPSRARQLIRKGDILVSTVRPNLNGVAAVTDEFDGATASTGFCVLRPHEGRLASNYLMHWVRAPQFVKLLVREAAGASYPAVSDRIVKSSPIPLPPLDQQRGIAAILDKADELRRKRKRALDLLDSLTQSIFLEMFGDLRTNPKHWNEVRNLGDLAEVVSGITKGRKLNGAPTRNVPYLAVSNVQDKNLDLSTVKRIDATEDEIRRYRLKTDDLLLTEGGDPDKLGRGTLWADELPEAIHQNHIFRVRVTSKKVLPLYLIWLIGSAYGKAYFLRSAKQTTGIASINKAQLSNFPVLLPPIHLQAEFAERVKSVALILGKSSSAALVFDDLFASLQSRAFSGQL
ncbi:MAG: restriction endonuclease subunit S [Xanthobacteraceae bacterium]|nr:restriction endonuclease subunit S [Xanthobacteraceae bacterium]